MEHRPEKPVVYMFAGPNGAGKSSIYEASDHRFPQINADVIQKENPDYTQSRAGIEAGRRIEELLKSGASFATENNFYKTSNLNTVARYQAAGYRVEVIYVGVASAELCRLRVAQRVANGGHNIPEKQIFERYHGGLATIQAHYQVPDKLALLDNSGNDSARNRQPLLTVEHGRIAYEAAGLPPGCRRAAAGLPPWVVAIRDHIRQVEGGGVPGW